MALAAATLAVGALALGARYAAPTARASTTLRPGRPGGIRAGLERAVAVAVLGSRPTNILLIGNNARDASSPLTPGQADLLFVVQVNQVRRRIVFISVPRDTLVAYPGWRDPVPKIKSAFFMGGPGLAMRAVARLTGLPIDGYVVADFKGFAAAIDAVGGVTLTIRQPIYDPLHSGAVFHPGRQHLNGPEVLAYIRVRQNTAAPGYRVSDFQRMGAAFAVLRALKHQVFARLSPGEIGDLLGIWRRDVATDLSEPELLALGMTALHARFVHVTLGGPADSMVLPTTALPGANAENAIEGAYYDVISSAQIERALRAFGARGATTGLPNLPAPPSVRVATDNAAIRGRLRAAGFQVRARPLGAAPGTTEVLYPPGELAAAEAVGQAVGQGTEVLRPSARAGVIEVLAGG